MIQDLEDSQIEAFIQQWHDLTFADEADKVRKRERLKEALCNSKAIRELAGNPLLLTMMAILNRNQELPRDRPELYNQASRVLLYQWDVERALLEDQRLDLRTIDCRDKQAMLRRVVYYMQSTEQGLVGNLISTNDLENILVDYLKSIEIDKPRGVTRLIINQFRTRNFILCYVGADSYAFVHRAFLEYFCAWEIVYRFRETQTLTLEEMKSSIFSHHWQDESWHEVLKLVVGMVDYRFADHIIDYLLDLDDPSQEAKNVFLASACFLEVRNHSNVLSISSKLVRMLRELSQNHPDYAVCNLALQNLAYGWDNTPEIVAILSNCAQCDPETKVREFAAQKLAELERIFSEGLSHPELMRIGLVTGSVRSGSVEVNCLP